MSLQADKILARDAWQEIKQILDACLKLPEGKRETFITETTAGKPELRQQVETMLAAYHERDPLLDKNLLYYPTCSPGNDTCQFNPEWAGKYLLLHRLGKGGMAEVFLAVLKGPAGFQQFVAVKRVHSQFRQDEAFRALFEYEARLSGRLSHPNIVQVHDFFSIDGTYMLAMEYVNGVDLGCIIHRFREKRLRLPIDCSVYIVNEICKGLCYAHGRKDDQTGAPLNIIHRDVSPRNVIVSFDGEVKVVDFGIAKAKDRLSQTATGTVQGTLQYMSPEVASGLHARQQSDLFSLGAILYELLAGERLFKSDNFAAILQQVRECTIPASAIDALKIDDSIRKVLTKALQESPDTRYQTAAEFLRDLEKCYSSNHSVHETKAMLETVLNREFKDEITLRTRCLDTVTNAPTGSDLVRRRNYFWWILLPAIVVGAVAMEWRDLFGPEQINQVPMPDVFRATTRELPFKEPERPAEVKPAKAPITAKTEVVASTDTRCHTAIQSKPAGAIVSLNGVAIGRTPLTVALRCGVRIEMALEQSGYETIRKPFRVNSDGAEVTIKMKPAAPK